MWVSKDRAEEVLQKFHEEWNGKCDIWAMGTGPAPDQYNAWGRIDNKDNIKSWAIHVYSSNETAMDLIPSVYDGIDVMVFVDLNVLENDVTRE